jgi:HSP20 family protein
MKSKIINRRCAMKNALEQVTRYPSIWDEMRAFSEALWGDNSLVSVFPKTDVVEFNDRYEMKMDLPGFNQKNVEIKVKDGVLTVASSLEEGKEKKVNQEEVKYLLKERRNVSFERSFRLPKDVKDDGIEATFAEGILTIKLPRKPEAQPRTIEIKAN